MAPGLGGYYANDLAAIRAGAPVDGLVYRGAAMTAGHAHIRNPAQAMVIRLRTDTGVVGWGDAVTVQYAGFAGREPPIDPPALAPELDMALDELRAAGAVTFAEACAVVEARQRDGGRWIRAFATASARRSRDRGPHLRPLAGAGVDADAGGARARARSDLRAERRGSPHERRQDDSQGCRCAAPRVDQLTEGVGADGDAFITYARWVRDRVLELGGDGYAPLLHFDVYGQLGAATGGDIQAMAGICERVVDACAPFAVQLESPLYGSDGDSTARGLADLRRGLAHASIPVGIVADDWCNTLADIRRFLDIGAADMVQLKMPDLGSITNAVEAILVSRAAGARVFVGGSCTETDLSARVSVQLAVAAGADQVLAKPGMGVDEALTITRNEMARVCMP